MKGRFSIALIVAVASVNAFQRAESAPQTPTFQSTTRLVQVNVIATDKNGKPVADLRRAEFSLFEGGRPQTVAVFAAERAKPVKPPVLPPNEFTNQLPSGNSARSGYTLILIDWLNTNFSNRNESQRQVLKLLQQVEMTDLVALCVLDRDLRVLHDFTADRAALARKLAATYAGLSEGPPGEKAKIADFPIFRPTELEHSPVADVGARRITRSLEVRRTLDTFSAIEQIASYLGTAHGRKSMIWVTSGFQSAMGLDGENTGDLEWSSLMSDDRRTFGPDLNRLVRRLNDADIAVYPVDTRGLIADPNRFVASRAYENLAGLKEIADKTGGRAYYNGNDLDQAIRSALDDSKVSYTLGYYPSNTRHDGTYRDLSVKVTRPGVSLRYRTGYEAENEKKPESAIHADVAQVFGNPLDTTSLPLSAHVVKYGAKLDVSIRFDPSALTFRREGNRRKGNLTVLYAFRPPGDSGKISIYSESTKLELPEEQYKILLKHGSRTFRKQIPLPATAASLRLAVRDEESGRIGSVTIPLAEVH